MARELPVGAYLARRHVRVTPRPRPRAAPSSIVAKSQSGSVALRIQVLALDPVCTAEARACGRLVGNRRSLQARAREFFEQRDRRPRLPAPWRRPTPYGRIGWQASPSSTTAPRRQAGKGLR